MSRNRYVKNVSFQSDNAKSWYLTDWYSIVFRGNFKK